MPEIPIEPSMPHYERVLPRIAISTSENWADVAEWTWGLARDKAVADDSVKRIASQLVAANASREEKVHAVYEYLQENIRYVFAHLGRGGYEPHFANEVIEQEYGDCKDQTILAVALLRELGIEAYPALVTTPRSGRYSMDIVALYFDHMIVWIAGDDQSAPIWMDTTGDRSLFPGMSNYLLNQPALIVDTANPKLVTIESSQLDVNEGVVNMHYRIDDKGHLIVDADLALSGLFEQNFRSWWRNDSNRETSIQETMWSLFPNARNTAKLTTRASNDTNLWQPFKLEASYDFGNIKKLYKEEPVTMGAGVSQMMRLLHNTNGMQIPADRKNHWINEQALMIRGNITFSSDSNELFVVDSGFNVDNDFFDINQTGKQIADNEYALSIDMAMNALDLSPQQYADYYAAIQDMKEAGHWMLRYGEKTEDAASTAPADDSLAGLLQQAQQHIDQGQFEQAMNAAKQAVDLDKKNAEAWYLLGVTQGYNALIDESRESFSEASRLGYQP